MRAGSRDGILTKLHCLLCLDPFVHRVDAFREIRKTHFDPYVGCDRVGLFVRTPEIFGRIGDCQLRSRELEIPYLAEVVGFAGGLFADYDRIGQVLEIHRIQDGRGECASPDDDIGFYAGVLFQEPWDVLPPLFIAAGIYLIIVLGLTKLLGMFERRLAASDHH